MADDIFNPRKRLLTDKETVELVEIIEAANSKIASKKSSDEIETASALSK